MQIREAMVLCAGLGRRMRPLTLTTPKPALPFLNRPALHWILETLEAHGVDRAVLNLHHLARAVVQCGAGYPGTISLKYSFEKEILGTAGAFGPVLGLFRGEALFIQNADTFCSPPYTALEGILDEYSDCLAVLCVRPLPAGAPYTPVSVDPKGRVKSFGSGDRHFTGVYAARRALFDLLPGPGPRELVPDLLRPLLPSGAVRAVPLPDPWYDLGTPESYLRASLEALSAMDQGRLAVPAGSRLEHRDGLPMLIHNSASVAPEAGIEGPLLAAEDTGIEARAAAGRCVLLPGAQIRQGERLFDAISDRMNRVPASF
jgi:mannose-1-phosphate guanylyltransferase